MKISIFLIFISAFNLLAGSGYSQDKDISLKLANVYTIENVISEIEKTTDYVFIYNEDVVPTLKKEAKVDMSDQSLDEILDQLIKGTDLGYKLSSKQITLYKDESKREQLQSVSTPLEIQQTSEKTITGRVTDAYGESLPGVTIVIKGTTKGTTTDVDGNFSLTGVPENSTLQFSFVGMKMQEIPIGNQTRFIIIMEDETIGLDEVVAIGYGTVRKSDITGSLASLKGDDIATIPTSNLMQSLSGRTPGVQVMQKSGAPGSGWNVQIRGANSIRGSNEPLYIVDGFAVSEGNITMLSNNDIENVEILKDASATAIYGSRGANGVVLITTKHGKEGITKVDFESSYGIQTLRRKLDLMDATEYATFYNQQADNEGLSPYFSQSEIDGFGKGFDWQDYIFSSSPIFNTSLKVSGGSDKTQFSVSGSVLDHQGIIEETAFERYSLTANLNHDVNKMFSIKYGAILTKSKNKNHIEGGGHRGGTLVSAAVNAPPTLTPLNDDGTYRVLSAGHPFLSATLINPINYLKEETKVSDKNSVLANLSLFFEPIDGLVLKIYGGVENIDTRYDRYQTSKFINSNGVANVTATNYLSLLNENTLSFNKTFNEAHSISAVAGFTYQDFLHKNLTGGGEGFLNDVLESYSLQSSNNPSIPSSSYTKSVLLSYLGRVNYSYKNKYLFTVSFRADGSSKYTSGDEWGYFPSGAFAWRLSEETFIKNNNFIDDLKLRASWGVSGSQAINAYQTLNQLSTGIAVFGKDLYVAFAPGNELQGDLKWESTQQYNLGFDLALQNFRHKITVDFYLKNTYNLLNSVSLPPSSGFTSTIRNVGETQNKGIEFTLDSKILTGEFKWDLSPNLTINRSKVLKLYDGQNIYTGNVFHPLITFDSKILREGEPMGVFYGYLTDGYDENGNEKYQDINKDGFINELDKTIIGNPNPDFIYGLNSHMSYKNFALDLFFQGSYGNDILNAGGISSLDYPGGLNLPKDVLGNNWTPNNIDAKYPINTKFVSAKFSERQLEDGSYLRLRNIQLSYNLPEKLTKNIFQNAQIYFSGQNLLTLTNYSWWDPANINSRGYGIDEFSYPTAKSYTLGVKLSF